MGAIGRRLAPLLVSEGWRVFGTTRSADKAALLRGPRADPAAHLFLRPYVKRAVYVGVADPSDGVPYWLISTRHPDRLAAALGDAGARSGGPGGGERQSVG